MRRLSLVKKDFKGFGQSLPLQSGMTGPADQQLQVNLAALGFANSWSGTYDASTVTAVQNFQYTIGISPVDGIYGTQTDTAMQNALQLLSTGKWNPDTDPMTYTPPATPAVIQAPTAPSTVSAPAAGTDQATGNITSSLSNLLSGPNLPWIVAGLAGVALLLFLVKGKGKEKGEYD